MELLVVIAIIALLLSLLLPSLASANMVAKRTRCAANMRAVAQSLLVYVQDFDQYVPPLDYAYGASFNNGYANWTTQSYGGGYASQYFNVTWLAALCESHDGTPTYLTPSRGECYVGSGMKSNLTSGNVLFCPASQPENNVPTSNNPSNLAFGGWGGGFYNGVTGISYNPSSPQSDNDWNQYRGAFHELEYSSIIASGTGALGGANNWSKKIGVQSWYGACGVSGSGGISGLWANTPIRRLCSDDASSERQGVKYSSLPNPDVMPFIHEGPIFNVYNTGGGGVYRIAAPHGLGKYDRTTNLAFFDGRVDTYNRSDILPITSGVSMDWTASGCRKYVKARDVKWRMDQ